MALFDDDNGEVKKLKKQITAQDLRIGLLESEKTSSQRQIAELTSKLSTLSTSASQDANKALEAEAILARLQADFNRQSVEKSNLQLALTRSEERYIQELKGKKFEEQRNDQALDLQYRQELEQTRKLTEKVKSLESKLREKEEEEMRRLSETRSATGYSGKSNAMEAEARCTLQASASSSITTDGQTPRRARRGRASSVSAGSALAPPSDLASRAQLRDLQVLYDEARCDLTRLEARATKAEKEALKASNEAMAKERQGENIANDLRRDLRVAQEDLKWKNNECDSLAKEVQACEKRLEEAETRARHLEASQSQVELQLHELEKARSSADTASQAELERLKVQLSKASHRCNDLEVEISSLRERFAEASTENSPPQSANRSSSISGAKDGPQDQPATTMIGELHRSPTTGEVDSADELAHLQERHSKLEAFCDGLQASVDELEERILRAEQEKSQALLERDNLRRTIDELEMANTLTPGSRTRQESSQSLTNELEELRAELDQVRDSFAEKEKAIELADALAEEDTRQLRIKESEVKHLNDETARLRQKAKESALEIEVLRASAEYEGSVDAALDELRAQIDIRDKRLQELLTSLKRKEDELHLGKKQLKRVATFLADRESNSLSEADTSLCTPHRKGNKHKSRVSFEVTATPVGNLLKSKHFFATPGGKQIQRPFEEDLLDQIELVRDLIERTEDHQRFLKAEQTAELQVLKAEVAKKSAYADELAANLSEAESRLVEILSQREQESTQRQTELLAEKDALIETHQNQILVLEAEVTRLQGDIETTQSSLVESEAQLQTTIASHASKTSELQEKLEAADLRATEVANLMQQLSHKRQQLQELEFKTLAVEQTEVLLQGEEVHIDHLEGSLHSDRYFHEQWTTLADETLGSLAEYRKWLQVSVQGAASLAKIQDSFNEDASQQVMKLQAKIAELEGRILRREEQIGSHQLKLENLTTQLSMAKEDYEELMEDKVDVEVELASVQERLNASLKESADALGNVKTEAEEANEALKEATQRLQAELNKTAALEEKNLKLSRGTEEAEAERDQQTAVLSVELAEYQLLVEQLKSEASQKQSSLNELNVSLQERQDSLHELQREHDQLIVDLEALKSTRADQEDSGEPSELQTRFVHLQREREALEQELAELRPSIEEERLKIENQVIQLKGQLAEVEARALALSDEKAIVEKNLDLSTEALTLAYKEAETVAERLRLAEMDRDARIEELATLKAGSTGQIDDDMVRSLRERIASLTEEATLAKITHDEAKRDLEVQLAQAFDTARLAGESRDQMDQALKELRGSAEEADRLQMQVSVLQTEKDNLSKQLDELRKLVADAEDAARGQQQALQQALSDAQAHVASLESEQVEHGMALAAAEAAIKERDARLESNNQEFWNLKEEMAELQEYQERSRVAAITAEVLEERLQAAQIENDKLREEVDKAKQEVSNAKQELESAEKESVIKSSEVADLQGEMKRRKAASRFLEEEMQSLKEKLYQAESGLQDRLRELKQADLELKTSHSELQRLEVELAAAKESPSAAQGANEALVEEVSYLNSRIEQMEQELSAKADEIEEADTRILTGLKENKKLVSRMKTLQKQLDALQSAQQQQQGQPAQMPAPSVPQKILPPKMDMSAPAPSSTSTVRSAHPYDSSNPALSPISSSFTTNNRKRPAPEESGSEQAQAPANSVRAVYQQPSSTFQSPQKMNGSKSQVRGTGTPGRRGEMMAAGGERFTPTRRSSPTKGESALPSSFLQDRTNMGSRAPTSGSSFNEASSTTTTTKPPVINVDSFPESEKKPAAGPFPINGNGVVGGGKERRPLGSSGTSTGGGLGGGAGAGGSGLMAALAKRKLTTRA